MKREKRPNWRTVSPVLAFAALPCLGSFAAHSQERQERDAAKELATRGGALQTLADHVFFPPARPSKPPEDVRKLRASLRALAASIESAQAKPDEAELAALDHRRRAAQSAFEAIGDRDEADEQWHQLMAAVWRDVQTAVASPGNRSENLEAALARVRAALGRSRPHGIGYTVISLRPAQ